MDRRNVLDRLGILEERVNGLEALPARVDALTLQIVQLREEMRDGFAAIRAETRQQLETSELRLRAEIRAGDEETRTLARALNEETRTHMLVLHEDLVERIKWLGEARPSSPGERARKPATGTLRPKAPKRRR